MKVKDIVFPVIATMLPVGIYELTKYLLTVSFNITVMVLSGFASFIALVIISLVLDALLNKLNRYRGQWIEELEKETETGTEKFIGIGIIRYDYKTNEHVFTGKTYTVEGKALFTWNIDYLRPDKDNSMQYICGVQQPNEMSIGHITFVSKDECEGQIWIMNSDTYKFNAYRITRSLANKLDYESKAKPFFKRPFCKSVVIKQKYCPGFAHKYAEKFFSGKAEE